MLHRVTYFLTSVLFIIPTISFGQLKIILSGNVTDKKQKALPYVSIGVYNGSILVRGVISDSLGNFMISLPVAKYTVKASLTGYSDYTAGLDVDKNISVAIILIDLTKELKTVNVIAQKPLIEHKIDRIVFNVENSIFNKGVDGIELLRQIPGLEVTDNDALKLIGKEDVKVMIDGRILNLTDDDVKQRIRSLRSDNISKIEVIPIAPAKYSAAGNGGLVNIVLKKNPLLGWQGFVNATYIQRISSSFSQSAAINYKSKRIEMSVNVNNDHSRTQNIQNTLYTFTNQNLNVDRMLNSIQNALSINSVFQYNLNRKMLIGTTLNYNSRKPGNNETSTSVYHNNAANTVDSTIISRPTLKAKTETIGFTAYYDFSIDSTGKKMDITYDYFQNNGSTTKDVNSEIIDSGQLIRHFIYNGDIRYAIHSIFGDFELPYRFARIETGGSFTNINNKTALNLYNELDHQLVFDSTVSNQFEYSERTSALYISGSRDLTKRLSTKLGVRYEYTQVIGNSKTLTLVQRKNYGKIFPTVFFLYNWKKNAVSLAYSKRIERPGFNDLNPFRYYTGVYSYVSGNPYLLPSYTENINLRYGFRNNLSILFSYTHLSDGIDYITQFAQDGTYSVFPTNHYNQDRFSLNLNYTYKLNKWWNLYTDDNLFHNKNKSYLPALLIPGADGFGGSFLFRSSLTLNKKRTTFWQINYNQFLGSQNGFSHSKSFEYFSSNLRFVAANGNLQCMLSMLDIFKQDFTVTERHYQDYDIRTKFNAKLQNFRISVNYTFGNKKVRATERESKEDDKYRAR